MKKKYLISSIILFFINFIFIYFSLYFILVINSVISFYCFMKYFLYDIEILNTNCDPLKFLELNKKQYLNNCFAILNMYDKKYEEVFLDNYEKAKMKKHKNNIYNMKLDYLFLKYKILNNEDYELEEKEFQNNWLDNKLLSISEQKYIKFFINKKQKSNCMLNSIIKHFEQGVVYYENEMYDLAKKEFLYVKEYGGTTIYKTQSLNYLDTLKKYKVEKINKERISIFNKYKCYKNSVDFIFCIYLVLIILQIQIGGIF